MKKSSGFYTLSFAILFLLLQTISLSMTSSDLDITSPLQNSQPIESNSTTRQNQNNSNENNSTPSTIERQQSFKVGDVSVVLPSPSNEFIEVGYDKRENFDLIVPSMNHLICAFVPTNDFTRLTLRDSKLNLSRYALIEIQRKAEYMDITPDNFKEVIDATKSSLGDMFTSKTVNEMDEELNQKLKSLDMDKVQLEKPLQLGSFFSKKDAYCFGMILTNKYGERSSTMAMGGILLRVKRRLLFVYLYNEYKGNETIQWLRVNTEKWADTILKANE